MSFSVACDGQVLIATLEVAESALARVRGLLGRDGLAPGHGLYLAPCRAIHTIGMRFSIDLIFVDRDWRVRRVVCDAGPGAMAWGGWEAYGVIEIASGWLSGRHPAPGAVLQVQAHPGTAGTSAAADDRP